MRHLEVVEDRIDGFGSPDDFRASREFFEVSTGIVVDATELHFGGLLAGPRAPDDLEEIRVWYAHNNQKFYGEVDISSRAVRARERARIEQARGIWERHELVVIQGLKGQGQNNDFIKAVRFFSDVTGTEIDVEIYSFGYRPGPRAEEDLKKIQAWYEQNGDRLYFDEDWLDVRVRSKPNERS